MVIVEGGTLAQIKPTSQSGTIFSLLPKTGSLQFFSARKTSNAPNTSCIFLPGDFYVKQLGFFCKQEIKIDRATKINLRLRLGSLEQCDWLEGKKTMLR